MPHADETGIHEGGCLCGAVRYVVRGQPSNVRICHCGLCRKAMASPFFARAMFPAQAVAVTGTTGRYPTSPRLMRAFCPTCGTRLFAEPNDAPARVGVALATLDDPNAFAPDCHIYVAEKLDWIVIADGLPQHPERP